MGTDSSGNAFEPKVTTYLHTKGRKLGIPVSGTFELTSRCNFNCKMCYIHSTDTAGNEPYELTKDEWLGLGKDAAAKGTLFLLLTGGEPMIRSDFPDIYEGLVKMGFVVQINTNASLIKGRNEEVLRAYPPFRMNVSLYGGSRETYGSLCGNDSFDTVTANIKKLKDMGVAVFINSVLTPYNYKDFGQIQSIADGLGCHLKTAAYMYPQIRKNEGNTAFNDGRFSPEEAAVRKYEYEKIHFPHEIYIDRLRKIRDGIMLNESECVDPTRKQTGVRCRAGSSSFWLDWRGNMSMCGMIPDDRFNVKTLGFDKAWAGVCEDTAKIRMPAECAGCKYRSFCNVCAAVCKSETGAFDKKPGYVCRLSEHTKKIVDELLQEEEKNHAE